MLCGAAAFFFLFSFTLEISWARASLQWAHGCQRLGNGAARGCSASLLGHNFNPPLTGWRRGFVFMLQECDSYMYIVVLDLFFLCLHLLKRSLFLLLRVNSLITFCIISVIRPVCAEYTWAGFRVTSRTRRLHFCFFFFSLPPGVGYTMSRRKQTNPFKVNCRYTRYCLSLFQQLSHPLSVSTLIRIFSESFRKSFSCPHPYRCIETKCPHVTYPPLQSSCYVCIALKSYHFLARVVTDISL